MQKNIFRLRGTHTTHFKHKKAHVRDFGVMPKQANISLD